MVRTLIGLAALVILSAALPGRTAAATPHRRHDSVFCPVLVYHHVKRLKPSDDAIERGLTVLPTEFENELNYLAREHYHTVSAARLVAYLRTGAPLPSKPVVITFDDGYSDVYETAFHALRAHHMVATFFIVPGFLDHARYLTWTQVKDMAGHGMDIESHTMSHPDLRMVPPAQVWNEVSQARALLQRNLHRSVRIFAYPYGTYNARVLADLRKAGYWAAFTTRQGWRPARFELLTLPRVYVDLDDTVTIFAGRLRDDPATLAADPT